MTGSVRWVIGALSLLILAGCAIGAGAAATSGYALKANTAEELSAAGEQRIVNRAKSEVLTELQAKGMLKP